MTRYYDSFPFFYNKLDKLTPAMHMGCSSLAEYKAWSLKARAKLHELLGLDRMVWAEASPNKLSSEKMDGYTREKWTIQTEPGVLMTFYCLVPDGIAEGEKRPAVIAAHGHASCGKEAVAGNGYFPELAEHIKQNNYAYGAEAVKHGFLVFCPDARGFGERREKTHQKDDPAYRMASSCDYLNRMGMPLGRCVAGIWTWELMRLMDYISGRDDVISDKIGCIGLSGGGLQTLYFSAMDERVAYAAISGYFYGFNESLLEMYNCSCNYVPRMWENFDVGDIGSLIAPRPLVIETGDVDPLNGKSGLKNVVPYVEQVRQAYKLFGCGDRLVHDIFKGPHMWHGVQSMEGLDKWLMG